MKALRMSTIVTGLLISNTVFCDGTTKSITLLEAGPSRFDIEATFRYQTSTRLIPNLTRADLPNTHPLHVDEFGMEDRVLGVFDVSGQGDDYYVVFSLGPSMDLNYCLYRKTRVEDAAKNQQKLNFDCDFSVYAPNLTIAANGWIYASGHNNTVSDQRRAFRVENNRFTEVAQPLYYVGKPSVSKREQQLYADEALQTRSFTLAKDEPVTIIAMRSIKNEPERILVANQHGITGWVLADMSQDENQFSGVFFAGD